MDIGNDSQSNMASVSDDVRLEASNRKLVMTPVHDDISPDDLPDEVVALHNTMAPAIANAPSDTEVTVAGPSSSATAPSTSPSAHHMALYASLSVVLLLGTILGFLLFRR